jgi:hypothetical protein
MMPPITAATVMSAAYLVEPAAPQLQRDQPAAHEKPTIIMIPLPDLDVAEEGTEAPDEG